jgi:hypothetical protein
VGSGAGICIKARIARPLLKLDTVQGFTGVSGWFLSSIALLIGPDDCAFAAEIIEDLRIRIVGKSVPIAFVV